MNMVSGPRPAPSGGDAQSHLRLMFRGAALYQARTAWGPFTALLVVATASFAPIALLFAAAVIASRSGVPAAEIQRIAAEVSSLSSPLGLGQAVLSQLLAAAIIWLAAGRGGLRQATLRLGDPKPGWSTAIAAGLILVGVTGAFELALYAASGTDPFRDSKWIADGLRSTNWWLVVLIAVLLAPLWEELAFRGLLLSALAQTRLGYWPSALISTSLWTMLHGTYSQAGLASVFVAGLALSWLMQRFGSIRITIVAHALANVAALAVAFFFAPVG